MSTVLITGATRGLGRETARRLAEAGHRIFLGSRQLDKGREAAKELGVEVLEIDVADDASVAKAAAEFGTRSDSLDVLINNAGIGGNLKIAGEMTADDLREVYETNVLGVVRTTNAFLPFLQQAAKPTIICVSSALASLSLAAGDPHPDLSGPFLGYASSKAAMNMVALQYARSYPDVRVVCVNPGVTATDMNGFTGQSVYDGTEAIVRVAGEAGQGASGVFVSAEGTVPW